jgi:hypothetical protein
MVKKAIDASAALASRNIEVLGQGSYRNNTNVRLDSDVDVCVRCFDTVYQDYTFAPGASDVEAGLSPATYSHRAFKDELEGAMRAYFGSGEVTRGNKVILIHENTYRISADVAPTFERRRYHRNAQGALWYESGTMLLLDRGGAIENWPHQHYDSGVAKNARTSKRFKAIVRIIKRLRNLMQEAGTFVGPAPSYLLECLVWNAPDSCFAHATLGEDIRSVMAFLVVNTASDPQ